MRLQKPAISTATTATLAEEGSVLCCADNAPLLSVVAEGQAQKLQTEVEQLRKALVDRDQANMALQAQNEQLQADLLNK